MSTERKQVKKFLKPKIGSDSGSAAAPVNSKRSNVLLLLGSVAVVVVALLWFAPIKLLNTNVNPVSDAQKEDPANLQTQSDAATRKASIDEPKPDVSAPPNAVPTYDEYIKLAKLNKWLPTDPILKLEFSILKYSQLFDVVDTTDTSTLNQYLQMMSQELQYLLAILKQSTDRSIDLTPAMRSAIDIIPEVTYRTMKLQLSTGTSKQTTRAQVTNNLQHWIYSPLRELIKLIATKPTHVTMNINQAGADAALVRVVKNRIYGLISVFLSLESSPATVLEALRVAVHQGDDLGVALVLNAISGPNGAASIPNHASLMTEFVPRLVEVQKLAHQLHFGHIASRIGGAMDRLAGIVGPPVPGMVPADKVDIFNQYFPYQRVSVPEKSQKILTIDAGADPQSGYSAFYLESIYAAHTNNSETAEKADSVGVINQCAIDQVDLADLSVERFYTQYVLLNRPVLIHRRAGQAADRVDQDTASNNPSSKVWRLDNLLKRFGSTKEVSSAIPYATLFGHKEEIVTLQDFVSGMQAYTKRLQEEVLKLGTLSLSEQQLLDVAATVGLPQYIFSGVQQNMNRAMRKHMLKSVLHYTSLLPSSNPTSSEVHRLLDLMHAVSRTYNSSDISSATVASLSASRQEDFKPHWKSQFYLGPALSGAPFHHHGPAFNLLVHGRKEWTLLPAGRDVYSSLHPLDWLREGGAGSPQYPYNADSAPATDATTTDKVDADVVLDAVKTLREREENGANAADTTPLKAMSTGNMDAFPSKLLHTDKPCKVIQLHDEVLFVPRHWTHQILNLGESVGFAVEIDDYSA